MKKSEKKIYELDKLLKKVMQWKAQSKKIIFTNGCFDILHLGHVDYLEKARLLGDRLIVAVNTDASVQELKGPNRPVQDEYARIRLLAALQFVNAVIFFDEQTPLSLIEKIKPDILVKGDDYTVDKIVGADIVLGNGGAVKTIELVKGYSTSNIVDKIKKTS
jgi:D-glycero-beta-D-manno-heptose 1-phosphate adenylyltransferase